MKQIPLSRGKRFALVDDQDFEYINQWHWHFGHGYATRQHHPKRDIHIRVYMHRVIMGAAKGQSVDHINHNRLDNRRENLRLCTHSQNTKNVLKQHRPNRSPYKGVRPRYGKWTAIISSDGKTYNLGLYATELEAAAAYNEAAKRLHGEFAALNDVPPIDFNPLGRTKRPPPRRTKRDLNPLIECACGCGQRLPQYDASQRPRKYISGHNCRGRPWHENRRAAEFRRKQPKESTP